MFNWQCGPSCDQGELNRSVCVSLGLESHFFEAADSDEGSRNLRKLVENKGIAFAVFLGSPIRRWLRFCTVQWELFTETMLSI
ncbi:hypothetical protein LOK49_LG08G01809 [Camellia lanceoleosa]|uniref:Uncharacterized protein n=1 Tax=Camellia lanceoleosa TaxID=1840588 RepID=A0ACC0GTI6_9ERIC|nr:hypothetical protein LOK49_LG08G01809 [Camellia lanceoleosa]